MTFALLPPGVFTTVFAVVILLGGSLALVGYGIGRAHERQAWHERIARARRAREVQWGAGTNDRRDA